MLLVGSDEFVAACLYEEDGQKWVVLRRDVLTNGNTTYIEWATVPDQPRASVIARLLSNRGIGRGLESQYDGQRAAPGGG